MFRTNITRAAIFLLAIAPMALADDSAPGACRRVENLRVDTVEEVALLADLCEVTGNLTIFTEGVREITLPKLERVRFINIDAIDLEAVKFTKLKKVDFLYISGSDLQIIELPSLQRVNDTFYLKARYLPFLNLPELHSVWKMNLQGNHSLKFVFADKLNDVYQLILENNPVLNPGSATVLSGATRVISPEEQEYIRNAMEEIREVKRRLIEQSINRQPWPPVGGDSYFDTYNFGTYYGWYPHYYYSYWHHRAGWGY